MYKRNIHILHCKDIRYSEISFEYECLFQHYSGKKIVTEYWSIPMAYVREKEKGIRVRIDNAQGKMRTTVKIPIAGMGLKEFSVRSKDLEEIIE